MKQTLHPIPRNLRVLLRQYRQRLLQKLNSPWTKGATLLLLALLVTRQELSLNLSINGASFLGVSSNAMAVAGSNIPGRNVSQLVANHTAPEASASVKKVWTAKQKRQLAYVANYRSIAQEEMHAHGVPASITLSQGLLESNIGKSGLATRNNNHFGIKCFSRSCKKGHCTNFSDDSHKDFFLTYSSPEQSYRDHSRLLKKDRYKKLFDLRITDYENWAHGLKKAGYATDPKYADKLIRIIKDLGLDQYDVLP